MKIVKASIKDAKIIAGLEKYFISEQRELVLSHFKKFVKMRNEKTIKKLLNDEKNKFFIAKDGDVVVGYIQCLIDDGRQNGIKVLPREGWIRSLFVVKGSRRNGVGKMLYSYAMKYFKKNRCGYVALNVLHGNIAKNIYKKWGFEDFRMLMKKKII